MAGLLDFLFQQKSPTGISPADDPQNPLAGLLASTSDDKKAAIQRGLLAAGLGIMGAKTGGNLMSAISQGGTQGIGAYDDQLQQAQKERVQGYQLQRQQKQDTQNDTQFQNQQTTFGNQQTQFAQGQQKTQSEKDLAAKYFDQKTGAFNKEGYINELWQVDPQAALIYQEKLSHMKAEASPYHTFISTADGIYSGDARTGQLVKALDGGGHAVIKDSADAGLQGRISGAKTGAEGDAKAVLAAKGADQKTAQLQSTFDTARSLLPQATQSGIGSMVDAGNRLIGNTTDSAKAAAQLETLSGWMTSNVPRMEGPQSDADVANYKIMAAKVGDRTVPYQERMQALELLHGLQNKYAQLNQGIIQSGNAPLSAQGQQSKAVHWNDLK